MKLQFFGAAGTVTGSMHLVEVGGRRLLLDCGLYQGPRKQAFEINRNLPFDAKSIDAVVISHAHIDHTGNLPSLVRAGYRGPIYATDATRDLSACMLPDSARLQVSDVRTVNKQRLRTGQRPFEPLYTPEDAARAVRQFAAVNYERPFEPLPGVVGRFFDAGHILGSASVLLELTENGRTRRLLFSGDIGRAGTPILRDPTIVPGADVIIMESTYGDRRHAPPTDTQALIIDAVQTVARERGTLIVPAFAVGRTQEVVYRLNELWDAGQLPPLPVYVDSPLAVDVTAVYRNHPECYDDEVLAAMHASADHDVFGFDRLRYVRSAEESKKLNSLSEPAIIVSASGMCEGGRVLHHLRNHIEQPNTTILFVGYQAENTLGRRILNGAEFVPIMGRDYRLRAQVRRAEGLSGHADCDELLQWAVQTQQRGHVDHVYLVHTETGPAEAFANSLRTAGLPNVTVPKRGEGFEL
ncbi:MAG: MBL fold metallo-hydrolase [Planctomycetia bacterium]|nr:MBL fold metallo-hydrolase [Planctomycetia bacterium]